MDLALVEAARSGDEEAFASIARGSADRLFAVAHRILRDVGRAEDAVQQTLVTAWRELPALRDIERFEAWIHRILVHTCYAEAKRASKWSANVVALPMDGPATPDTTLTHRDARLVGSRVPPASDGATRGLRAASLPRLVGQGDRREPRRPDRNDQVEAPLRNFHPPGGARSRCPDDQHQRPGSGWHERERIRSNRPSLARGRPDPNVRPRRAVRPRGDPHDSTAPCLVAGAEGNTCEHLRASGHCRGPRGRRRPRGHQRPSARIGRIWRRRRSTASPSERTPPLSAARRRRHSRADADLRLLDQRLLDRLPRGRHDPAGNGGLECLRRPGQQGV